jgi:hypothetical protein
MWLQVSLFVMNRIFFALFLVACGVGGAGVTMCIMLKPEPPQVKSASQLRCEKAISISSKIDRTKLPNLIFVALEAAHEQVISQDELLVVKRRLNTPGENLGKLADDVQARLLECIPVLTPHRPIQ